MSKNINNPFVFKQNSLSYYISNLKNELYIDYLKYYQQYLNLKDAIIDKKFVSNKINETNYYKENNSTCEVLYDNLHFTITKPIYINIWKQVNILNNLRDDLNLEYDILLRKILFSDDSNTLTVKPILEKLYDIDNEIKTIFEYYLTVNNFDTKYSEAKDKIIELNEHTQTLYEKIENELDKTQRLRLINVYINTSNENKKHINDCKNILTFKNKYDDQIDFIILTLPDVKVSSKIIPIKKKIITKNIEDKVEELEDKIKQNIANNFRFRNVEQCSSQKRSAAFYMSKDEIITIINNNNDIKSIMPHNYKALKKNEICEILSKNNFIS
jgi:hypothetical protein